MKQAHLNYLIGLSALLAIGSDQLGFAFAFTILKPLTTILVILLVVLHKDDRSMLTTLVVVALIACLGGDVLLLDDARFAYGLSSFLFAHILFAYVFFKLISSRLYFWPLLALSIFAACFYLALVPHLGELAIPVAIYQICICIMCWLAINVYLSRRDHAAKLLCIAGLLFVFSDSIIAVNKFLFPFELSGLVILASYWLSIAIIANAYTQLKHRVSA